MKIRYTGVGGESITNQYGTWNVNAPDVMTVEETDVPHPQSPVKEVPDDEGRILLRLAHFEPAETDVVDDDNNQ